MKTNSRIECEMQDLGFDVNTHRFPYTYHHDFVLSGVSRSDVAKKLRDACDGDMNVYDYSACYGAILYLVSQEPEKVSSELCELLDEVREYSIYGCGGLREMNETLTK